MSALGIIARTFVLIMSKKFWRSILLDGNGVVTLRVDDPVDPQSNFMKHHFKEGDFSHNLGEQPET